MILFAALAAAAVVAERKKLYRDQAQIDFMENLPNDAASRAKFMSIYNEMATFHNMVGKTTQHILVLPVTLNKDNSLSYNLAESLKYENMDWAAFEKSPDYDPDAEDNIEGVCTIWQQEPPIEDRTVIHTELQFMFGKTGKALLAKADKDNKMVYMFSYYIPCAQNNAGYGECAGEMGCFQKTPDAAPFIISYKDVFRGTNQCVSRTYLGYGGMPLLKESGTTYNIDGTQYVGHVERPEFVRFPRISMNGNTAQQHLITECFSSSALVLSLLKYNPTTATEDDRTENRIFHILFLTSFVFGRPNDPPNKATVVTDYVSDVRGMAGTDTVKLNKIDACKDYTIGCYGTKRKEYFRFDKMVTNLPAACAGFLTKTSVTFKEMYTALSPFKGDLFSQPLQDYINKNQSKMNARTISCTNGKAPVNTLCL